MNKVTTKEVGSLVWKKTEQKERMLCCGRCLLFGMKEMANRGKTLCTSCYNDHRRCTNIGICVLCMTRKANPGRAWCEKCFQTYGDYPRVYDFFETAVHFEYTKKCVNWGCYNEAVSGSNICSQCYDKLLMNGICTNCRLQKANPGFKWCQSCYNHH